MKASWIKKRPDTVEKRPYDRWRKFVAVEVARWCRGVGGGQGRREACDPAVADKTGSN